MPPISSRQVQLQVQVRRVRKANRESLLGKASKTTTALWWLVTKSGNLWDLGLFLIGLRSADQDDEAVGCLSDVADVEVHNLGSPETAGVAHEDESAVAMADQSCRPCRRAGCRCRP